MRSAALFAATATRERQGRARVLRAKPGGTTRASLLNPQSDHVSVATLHLVLRSTLRNFPRSLGHCQGLRQNPWDERSQALKKPLVDIKDGL